MTLFRKSAIAKLSLPVTLMDLQHCGNSLIDFFVISRPGTTDKLQEQPDSVSKFVPMDKLEIAITFLLPITREIPSETVETTVCAYFAEMFRKFRLLN